MENENVISQEILESYLRAKDEESRLKELVKGMLQAGASVEKGERTAKLVTQNRKSPDWKGEFTKLHPDLVGKIIENTPEKEVIQVRIK